MRNEKYMELHEKIIEKTKVIEFYSYQQAKSKNSDEWQEKIDFTLLEIEDLLEKYSESIEYDVELKGYEIKILIRRFLFWLFLANAIIVCYYLWYGLFFGASLLEILFC